MNGAGKRKFSKGEGCLLLRLVFAEKKFLKDAVWNKKGNGLENFYNIKESYDTFRTSCEENIVLEISGNTIAKPRLEGVFHVFET